MKNMQILIDTNVILDWLMHREPFSENAKYIMEEAMFGNVEGYLTAHTFSDLFYILRKDIDGNSCYYCYVNIFILLWKIKKLLEWHY